MLYGDLIIGAAGAGERKFPRAGSRGQVICWHGPGLASLPEQWKRISPYRYV